MNRRYDNGMLPLGRISVVVPVLNEAGFIATLLTRLEAIGVHEVVVVDGLSSDGTVEIAEKFNVFLLRCAPGRGGQLNAGARVATGEILWFLHADTMPALESAAAIRRVVASEGAVGGNLHIVYEGGWEAHMFTRINNWRCRFGVFYGDSGIFCRRDVFEALGGFRNWPVLEDYEFARRVRRVGPVRMLEERIEVSARRWQRDGLFRTLWTWFWIQALYYLGVSPARLARWYRHVR